MSEPGLVRADSANGLSLPKIPPPRTSPRQPGSPKVSRAQSSAPLPPPPLSVLNNIRRDSNSSLAESHDEKSMDSARSLTDDSNISESENEKLTRIHKGSISISFGPTPIVSAKARGAKTPTKKAAAPPKASDSIKKQRPAMSRSGEIKLAKQGAGGKSATMRSATLRKSKDLTDSGKIKKLTKSTLSAAVEIPKETRSAWEHKLELDYAEELQTKLGYNKQIDDLHFQEELGKLIIPTIMDITSRATTTEQLQLKYLLVFLDTTDPITSNTIYRKKGKPAEVKKLRKDLDKLVADYEKEHREDKEKKDKKDKKDVGMRTKEITSAGELLKDLLKAMPDPLIPTEFYFDALAAHGLEGSVKLLYVRDLVREVKGDQRLMLQMLLIYMLRLSENSIKNEFTLDEISQVFCPYIIADKASFEQTKSAEESVPSPEEAAKVVSFMINNYKFIFMYEAV
jgi:hypothetical protein